MVIEKVLIKFTTPKGRVARILHREHDDGYGNKNVCTLVQYSIDKFQFRTVFQYGDVYNDVVANHYKYICETLDVVDFEKINLKNIK